MYVPAHFEESRPEVLHDLIRKHPFGILFTSGSSGLDANHLPFELKADQGSQGVLHAHVARNNPVWQDVGDCDEVLVVFRAGDAYVSRDIQNAGQMLKAQGNLIGDAMLDAAGSQSDR